MTSPNSLTPAIANGQVNATGFQLEKRIEAVKAVLHTTPGILRVMQVVLLLFVLLFGLLAWSNYSYVETTTQAIGKDTVPSIIAAENVRSLLATAHSQALQQFLEKNGKADDLWDAYRSTINQAHDALLSAAQNITYGDEERKPIYAVMTNLSVYEELMGQARATGKYDESVRQADQLMTATILPATVALDKANHAHLDSAYTGYTQTSSSKLRTVVFVALSLVIVLLGAQAYLFKATKRILNLPLAAATLIFTITCGLACAQMVHSQTQLKIAKEDAFDSVNALWAARATASEALSDETMYLLEANNPAGRQTYLEALTTKANALLNAPPNQVSQAVAAGQHLPGLLGDELANITFDGEKEAALSTVQTWNAFRVESLTLPSISGNPGAGAAFLSHTALAFNTFNKNLDKTLTINQTAFDKSVENSFESVSRMLTYLLLSVVAVIAGCFLGFRNRISEYNF